MDERRSSEARAIPTAGIPHREFNSRLRVGSWLYSPHAYRYEWFSSEARLCHASLLGSLDVAVNIDVIVLVIDWACRRFPASTYWLNHVGCSPGLALFSRGIRNVRQERGLTPKGDRHEICQLHCRNSDACRGSRRLRGPVLTPALATRKATTRRPAHGEIGPFI
jgi:hypothetical protein